jgi:hypothetical protein
MPLSSNQLMDAAPFFGEKGAAFSVVGRSP